MRASLALSILLAILACLPAPTLAQATSAEQHVVMISFDGFRPDYAERWQLPSFLRMASEGGRAKSLLPIYPSKTFPNHYSLVTGLYAGHHGLVDNSFFDRRTGSLFSLSRREAVEDPRHYGGVPLWQHLQDYGIRTAAFFWVGSEAPVGGRYPDFWRRYDESVDNEQRVQQVLNWLALPLEQRPRFITAYFSLVDSVAHEYGPDAEETRIAAQEADRLLGLLMAGLDDLPLRLQLLVVSDHGMYSLRHEEASYIGLEPLGLPREGVRVVSGQTQVQLYLDQPDSVPELVAELSDKADGFRVLPRQQTPPDWHYDRHPSIGDILLIAEPGRVFTESLARELSRDTRSVGTVYGVHGYDAKELPELHGIFYARGSDMRPGTVLEPFENIAVFPFVTQLFGVGNPTDIDGTAEALQPLLLRSGIPR